MAGEENFFEAQLPRSAAQIQQLLATVRANIARQSEIAGEQDQTLIQLRGLEAKLAENAAVPLQAGNIQAATQALEQQNVLRRQGVQFDNEALAAVRAQIAARTEQVAIVRALQNEEATLAAAERVRQTATTGTAGTGVTAVQRVAAAERVREATLAADPSRVSVGQAAASLRPIPVGTSSPAARSQLLGQQSERVAATDPVREAQRRVELEAQRARLVAQELEQERLRTQQTLEQAAAARRTAVSSAYQIGRAASSRTAGTLSTDEMAALSARPATMPKGVEWTAADQGLTRYNAALGEYGGYAQKASLGTGALSSNLTRLGVAQSEASNAMRRHGALTTEYFSALARGETTVQEFGYQVGATVAKFAGWTAAATATYTTLGAIFELGKGAVDASSGVQQLHRTIDNLDTGKATEALNQLSRETNVPIKEASEAMFQFSRTFHSVDDAAEAARLGLAGFKLDQVNMMDSVKLQTELFTQFNMSAHQQAQVYDMLSAGQREYNARMQQTIPLVGQSAGTIRNAGGDLNQLIQLAVYAQRSLPTFGGTQIGTAFRRSAATFLNPDTTKGQADRKVLEGFGINVNQGWTQTFQEALLRSQTLGGEQRNQLSLAMFGPQLGARMGGLFSPEGIQNAYRPIIGPGAKGITPGATAGSLDKELATQLKTARETMHSFVNELQRLGVELGKSGIINGFTGALKLLVHGLSGVGAVVGVFAGLPDSARKAVLALMTVSATLLLLNRTRWGSSLADATGLSKIPGIGASPTTATRFQLRVGTRAAQEAVEADLRSTTQNLLANGAQRVELEQQRLNLIKTAGGEENLQTSALVQSNALKARIAALEREALVIERERIAQLDTLQGLNLQQTRLRKRGGYSREEIATMGAAAMPPATGEPVAGESAGGVILPPRRNETPHAQLAGQQVGAAESAAAAEAAAAETAVAAAATAGESEAVSLLTVARAKFARALEIQAAALRENVTMAEVTDAMLLETMTKEELAAAEITVGAATMTTASTGMAAVGAGARAAGMGVASFAGGLGAFLRGMNPMMVAMLALPFLLDEINAVNKKASDATKAAADASNESLGGYNQLIQSGHDLVNASQKQAKPKISGGPIGILQNVGKGWGSLIGGSWGESLQNWSTGRDPEAAAQTAAKGQTRTAIGDYYKHTVDVMGADASDLVGTKNEGSLYGISARMKTAMRGILDSSGLSKADIQAVWAAYLTDLQSKYKQAVVAAFKSSGPKGELGLLEKMDNKELAGVSKAYGARAQAYGLSGGDTRKAAGAYLVLANRMFNDNKPEDLQELVSAQQAWSTAVQKNVTDITHAAKAAPTYGGEMGTLNRGMAQVNQRRREVDQWVAQMRKEWGDNPKRMKAIESAANQMRSQIDDFSSTLLDEKLTTIKSAGDLRTSKIGGISPAADLQRSTSDLQTLKAQLQAARAAKAGFSKIADLESQVNNAEHGIVKQRADNADQFLQDQNALAVSQIGGASPEADLARQQKTLQGLYQLQALHRTQNRGPDQAAKDQAAINSQANTVRNQRVSMGRDILLAQDALQKSTITGQGPAATKARLRADVKTAQDALAYDRANGAGQKAVLDDMRAVNDAWAAFNTQAAQHAAEVRPAYLAYLASTTRNPIRVARFELQAANEGVALAKQTYGTDSPQYWAARAAQNQARQKVHDATVQTQEAKEKYVEAMTIDPVKQARLAVTDADRGVREARSTYGANSAEYWQARSTQTQAQQKLHDATVQREQAQGQLLVTLQQGSSVQAAQTTVSLAQAQLKEARDVDEQIAARTALASAQYALHQAQQSYIASLGQLAASQTRDPLAQLAAQIAATARALKSAQGPDETIQLQTQLNGLRNQYEETLISQREATIDFQLQMQQISTQQAIQQLKALEASASLTTQERQQVQLRIRQLQMGSSGGGFDLAPGSIKLPTVYDIRRAMQGAITGKAGLSPAVQANMQTTIYVNVNNSGDLPAVADALDRATTGQLSARLRAAGVIGGG